MDELGATAARATAVRASLTANIISSCSSFFFSSGDFPVGFFVVGGFVRRDFFVGGFFRRRVFSSEDLFVDFGRLAQGRRI